MPKSVRKLYLPILFVVLVSGAQSSRASAQTILQVGAVGPSFMSSHATIEAFREATAIPGNQAGYFTGQKVAQIDDQRGDPNIYPQLQNLSVVWDNPTNPAHVWYYLSTNTADANRAYFGVPRAKLFVVPNAQIASLIDPNYFSGTAPQSIPSAVLAIVSNSMFTAAFTDISPADAVFAVQRSNCGTSDTATLGCLGYGSFDPNVGLPIYSGLANSDRFAQPVAFNIFGNDPITGKQIPAFTTVPIGVAPLIFVVNRYVTPNSSETPPPTELDYQSLPVLIFAGNLNAAFPVNNTAVSAWQNVIRQDPLSGSMNTFEYTVMLPFWSPYSKQNFWFSQEGHISQISNSLGELQYVIPGPGPNDLGTWGAIQPANNNPLTGRAIGDDEVIASLQNPTAIGYIFFSFAGVAPIALNSSYGYLTYGEWPGGPKGSLIETDPINPNGAYNKLFASGNLFFPGNGELPICGNPCSLAPNTSFPNVRNGAYLQWSLFRALADTGSISLTSLQTLTSGMANNVNSTSPDFVPFNPTTDGDNGLQFYRSHFSPTGVNYNASDTPKNGIDPATGLYIGGEAGGDVGGCVDWRYAPNGPTNILNCRY